jgi:hypothetical protein
VAGMGVKGFSNRMLIDLGVDVPKCLAGRKTGCRS